MTSFTGYSLPQLNELQNKIIATAAACVLYEEAAQKFSEALYTEFSPSVVLARMFVSIPYGQLPAASKTFVSDLGKSKGVSGLINDKTMILSLVGTAGQAPAWNDRRQSQGHLGIPLCSAEFIDAIPMMSRLLQELGLNLAWFDKSDLAVVEKAVFGQNSLFYVANAGQATDAKGRKIIPAQDFVAAYGVRTVFGMGTSYVGGAFAVSIFFTNETIAKDELTRLTGLINTFKVATSRLAGAATWLAA
jgi:hypothetical protein